MKTMEEKELKEYEVGFLISEEGGVHEVVRLLRQHEAETTLEGSLKKIAFSYPIKKQIQGFFGFVRFKGNPNNIPALERDLKTNSIILRCLLIKTPAMKPGSPRAAAPKEWKKSPSRTSSEPKPTAPLSNEALEKKIEEILQ